MKLPLIVFGFWAFFYAVLAALARLSGSLALPLLAALVYVGATSALEYTGYQALWLRNSRLIRRLQKLLLMVDHDVVATPGRQTLYAVEPHGEACLGFATTFAPSADGRVRLLAWSIFRYVPFLRDLYLLGGVVPSAPASAERWLAAGADLAVIPSGVRGLYHAVVDAPPPPRRDPKERKKLRVYKVNLGFCALAIKRRLLLVPVLSCNEQLAFVKWRLIDALPFLSTLIVGVTLHPQVTVLGEPIDARDYDTVEALADEYYGRLAALGASVGYEVELIDCTSERKRSKRA